MNDAEAMIISQEGTGPYRNGKFFAYDDATGKEIETGDMIVGKISVGYGHNIQAKGLNLDVVYSQLKSDLIDAIEDIRHNYSCYDTLTRPRQLVLISMAFNLGRDGLAKFVRFSGAVHRGDWEEAAAEIENSKAASQAPARYKELARMMRTNSSAWV